MSTLTKEEKSWIRKMDNLLKKCPDRIGFYTIGDPHVMLYDKTKPVDEHFDANDCDFCQSVAATEADLLWITFPSAVHSTAG